MSENETKNDQEVLVFHVEGLEAYRSEKTPVIKIPSDLPQWKQELHRKKEKEKMEKHRAKMSKQYEESQTPEWKKPLIELHRRRKSEQSEKQEAERIKAEEERQYFEALPAWKKQLIYKKRATSAENLLCRCKQKNELNKSDISKCKAAENTGRIQDQQRDDVNVGSDTGNNDDEENNENEISDSKKEEHTINDEAEASVDEIMKRKGEGNIENREVEHDNTGDGDQTDDFGNNKCAGIDVNLKVFDNERKSENTESDEQLSNEENENNEELLEDTSENPGNDGNEEMIPGEEEKEDETECLIENDNETEDTRKQQVEERSELDENENKDDQNKK